MGSPRADAARPQIIRGREIINALAGALGVDVRWCRRIQIDIDVNNAVIVTTETFLDTVTADVPQIRERLTTFRLAANAEITERAWPAYSRDNNSTRKEGRMAQIKVKLAEGQSENVEVGGITVSADVAEHNVSDEVLAELNADERVSVETAEPAA